MSSLRQSREYTDIPQDSARRGWAHGYLAPHIPREPSSWRRLLAATAFDLRSDPGRQQGKRYVPTPRREAKGTHTWAETPLLTGFFTLGTPLRLPGPELSRVPVGRTTVSACAPALG